MKKIVSLLLVLVMAFTLLTGCSDPVYDEFENFLNVEMVETNANYEKITAEAGKWEKFEEDAQLEASLKDVMLPLVEDSLERLGKISLETEEVKEIKAKYVKVMEAYKEGFTLILESIQKQDADKMNEGNEKINEGISLLDEYNKALETMAEKVGAEIEY
ncbi:MAG: hypothetical protein E7404_03210 [Ruminococcaceae bacterium]|nr:hypothetical protein [Oscillospiraceae bacterium]